LDGSSELGKWKNVKLDINSSWDLTMTREEHGTVGEQGWRLSIFLLYGCTSQSYNAMLSNDLTEF
jgi:hypothetical protein